MATKQIEVYGATWCGDTKRAREYFDNHGVSYEWHNVDEDEQASEYVLEVNNGNQVIPVIKFQDDSILVEPSNEELESKLSE